MLGYVYKKFLGSTSLVWDWVADDVVGEVVYVSSMCKRVCEIRIKIIKKIIIIKIKI